MKKLAKALILYQEKNDLYFLELTRPSGEGDLPGGKVDEGELPAQALIREVKEETGLILNEIVLLTVYSFSKAYDFSGNKSEHDYEEHLFCSLAKTKNIIIDSHEHRGYRWVLLKDINRSDLPMPIKKIIAQQKGVLPTLFL